MKKYSDRPWYYFYLNREQWYQMQAEEYEGYFNTQQAIADHRLKLLQKLGYEYDVVRDMYIKVEDGSTLWT